MDESKLDVIISQLVNITKQLTLVQAVLLDLTRAEAVPVGSRRRGWALDQAMDGCEDQTPEPSDGDDDGDDGDGGDGGDGGDVGNKSSRVRVRAIKVQGQGNQGSKAKGQASKGRRKR